MDYPMLEAQNVTKVIGDKLFIEWEEAKKDLLGGRLVNPDTQTARHYTGVVLKIGTAVEDERLAEGSRVFFEQFSNFEKFQSNDGKKRFAFIREGDCYAIIPPRSKVACEDWTQYGEGEE